jgi:hypothetical protein
MLGVTKAISLAHRLASAQDQAYCPCELGMMPCGDYCQTSREVSNRSQGLQPRKTYDHARSGLLRGSSPLFAAKLD